MVLSIFFFATLAAPLVPHLFPYTTLFRSTATIAGVDSLNADLIALETAVHDERSEEHTSELQSRFDLVCRLLLEKKNQKHNASRYPLHRIITPPSTAR